MTFSTTKELRWKMKDSDMRVMQAACLPLALNVNPLFLDINRLLFIDMKSIIIPKMSTSIIKTNPDINAFCQSGKVRFQHRTDSIGHSLARFCWFPRFYSLVPNAQGRCFGWSLQDIVLPELLAFWRIVRQCVRWFSRPIYASLASFDGDSWPGWCFGFP